MTKYILGLSAFWLLSFVPSEAPAAITLTIDTVGPVAAGSVANVDVYASSGDGTSSIFSYFLQFDIGGNGNLYPLGFSTPTISAKNLFANADVDEPITSTTYDFSVDGSGGSTALDSSDTLLFTLAFDTEVFTPGDTYDLSFVNVNDPDFGGNNFNVGGTNPDLTLQNGSITISATAVPEPSTLLALGLVGGGAYLRRRKKNLAALS